MSREALIKVDDLRTGDEIMLNGHKYNLQATPRKAFRVGTDLGYGPTDRILEVKSLGGMGEYTFVVDHHAQVRVLVS